MPSIGDIQEALAALRNKIEEARQAAAMSKDETEETREVIVELGAESTAAGLARALDLHDQITAALTTALETTEETVSLVQAVREGKA